MLFCSVLCCTLRTVRTCTCNWSRGIWHFVLHPRWCGHTILTVPTTHVSGGQTPQPLT